jgi:phosphatidylglycerol---prolipoprotein diacylglyceryl transferase
MFPVIQIGPLSLQAPGLILLIGIWLGLTIAERLSPRFQISPNQLYNLVFIILISGLIGARLSYVLQNLNAFTQSPLNLFSLNPGLLDPLGGAAVVFITGVIYVNRKQVPVLPSLDALSPFFAVMWIALGLSNLASGKAFGMETQLLWGIELWGATRHPTQIYQILAGFVILAFIWPQGSTLKFVEKEPGKTFGLFLALSAGAWIIIETFRGDSTLLPGGIRTGQVAAWVGLAISLWILGKVKRKSAQAT